MRMKMPYLERASVGQIWSVRWAPSCCWYFHNARGFSHYHNSSLHPSLAICGAINSCETVLGKNWKKPVLCRVNLAGEWLIAILFTSSVYISSALWNLFCSGFKWTRVRRIVLYCRTDGMLLHTDFTGTEEKLVQLFLGGVRRMGSTGASRAKAKICLAPTHTHTHTQRERGRGIIMNSLISESWEIQSLRNAYTR